MIALSELTAAFSYYELGLILHVFSSSEALIWSRDVSVDSALIGERALIGDLAERLARAFLLIVSAAVDY